MKTKSSNSSSNNVVVVAVISLIYVVAVVVVVVPQFRHQTIAGKSPIMDPKLSLRSPTEGCNYNRVQRLSLRRRHALMPPLSTPLAPDNYRKSTCGGSVILNWGTHPKGRKYNGVYRLGRRRRPHVGTK